MKFLIIMMIASSSFASDLKCFYRAYNSLNLTMEGAANLCKLNDSDIPINCYRNSQLLGVKKSDSIFLCENAKTLAPYECLKQSENLFIRLEQRVILCTRAKSLSPIQCFKDISQKHSHLSNFQKALLCSGN